MASLPPISADIFTDKVLQARAASTAEADKAYFERTCDACHKIYYSENAYHNHLLSQKHKLNETSVGNRHDDETRSMISSTFSLGEPIANVREAVDSDAEDEFSQVVEGLQKAKLDHQQRPSPVKRPSNPHPVSSPIQDEDAAESSMQSKASSTTERYGAIGPKWTPGSCIFCNYESPSTSLNANHMERFHGMFIPEKSYLVDLDGLINQLQQKVRDGNQCLYCSKVKSTVFGVQTHMRDKGHCKIPYTTEEEQIDIGDYYDFRSTYSDDEASESGSDEERLGGAKLGARRPERITGSDGEELDKEIADGWETDSSASSLDSADLTAVPAEGHIHQFERLDKHPHHSHHDPRNHHQVDGWHSRAHKHTHAAFFYDYELHLPSGKSVGHRSLQRYYRQNLVNYPTPEERIERLAIEAAERDEMDPDDEEGHGRVVDGRGREIMPRGAAGLVGVSTQKKQLARQSEQRGRKLENVSNKKRDLAYSTKLNNYKGYYYRYTGGG